MERSARFISLSGWSGIWAGCTALAGSYVTWLWSKDAPLSEDYNTVILYFVMLAVVVLLVALTGAYYFTWRNTRLQGGKVWNSVSRRLMMHITFPMAVGGVFVLKFLCEHNISYIAATCLVFYGLALINGSRYTLSDVRYLGLCEVILGCISLFVPGYSLMFWALGFGVVHIVYGVLVWNKYDKHTGRENA